MSWIRLWMLPRWPHGRSVRVLLSATLIPREEGRGGVSFAAALREHDAAGDDASPARSGEGNCSAASTHRMRGLVDRSAALHSVALGASRASVVEIEPVPDDLAELVGQGADHALDRGVVEPVDALAGDAE